MERSRLLWVHVATGCESAVARSVAEEYFQVSACPSYETSQQWAARTAPDVVCWDFEEADAAPLRAMRDFKAANPGTPLLMLTAQHSEELAVWAFRARVWNYFTKPVPLSELHANFRVLVEMLRAEKDAVRSVRQLRALMPEQYAAYRPNKQPSSLQAAVSYVEAHYAGRVRQADVAASVGMSISAFSRAFRAEYGLTFSDYLMRFRIGQACCLLRMPGYTATTAGLAVGFDDLSHFARAFRRLMGMSPSTYKRQRFAARHAKEVRENRKAALRGPLLRNRRADRPLT
jgi:AraC-like DNA-binding protein/ActR/RegA family two-component response regulator